MLREYSFPGNVRELENAMERAVTYFTGEEITPEDLLTRLRDAQPSLETPSHGRGDLIQA